MSVFTEPEIYWRINREFHVGMIVRSTDRERILSLLENYMHRIYQEFHASAPVPDKPTN